MIIGYARVSTPDQTTAPQIGPLVDAGCVRIFEDTASGALTKRPQLERCLDHLALGDTLVVWRLDRLGRNRSHLFTLIGGLDRAGVVIRCLNPPMDTSSIEGRMFLGFMAILADTEREWGRSGPSAPSRSDVHVAAKSADASR